MNFQQVEQGNGKLVQMFGVFTEIGGLQYTPQQKAKAICKIRDDTGVEHKVHIYQGRGQLPSPEQFNQRCQFNLSTFQGTYEGKPYTGYSGFWQQDQQQSLPPKKAQQPPQQAAQQPNGHQNDRNTSIERQAAFKAACEYAGRHGLNAHSLIEIARAGHYFIETGKNFGDIPKPDKEITSLDYAGESSLPTGDEIPF